MTVLLPVSVLDCEPPSIPEEALFKREGDVGTVTCNNGAGTWQLKCQDGQWQGQYGTCTAGINIAFAIILHCSSQWLCTPVYYFLQKRAQLS